jgi:hypothetical protein
MENLAAIRFASSKRFKPFKPFKSFKVVLYDFVAYYRPSFTFQGAML